MSPQPLSAIVLAQVPQFFQGLEDARPFTIFLLVVVGIFVLILLSVLWVYGGLFFQAYFSRADVSMASLVGMGLRGVNPRMILSAKVMAAQAGLNIDRRDGISTSRLEAHTLAGGNVLGVIQSIIAAQRAGIPLEFDQAAAIDLAGRDVLDAVRTSVHPKVIDCPDAKRGGKTTLSAIAR
ncbi:MAG TPA: flotillin-like FloA family protein, partial [Pirellulaceae bacterium]